MGGFFLRQIKSEGVKDKSYSTDAIKVFNARGQDVAKRIIWKSYELILFKKLNMGYNSYVEFPNKDFIASTGTLFYNGKIEKEALKELYSDFKQNKFSENNISGNYCVILAQESELVIFRDYLGYYPVYVNNKNNIISSSFLAVFSCLEEYTFSSQEFYEYLFSGFFYSRKTFITPIELLDESLLYYFSEPKKNKKRFFSDFNDLSNASFKEAVESVTNTLNKNTILIKQNFENNVSLGISGGYDSRLILAALNAANIRGYHYVYGTENSSDVIVAKEISKRFNIPVIHTNKNIYQAFSDEDYYNHIKRMFFLYDGLTFPGYFDNGNDYLTKQERTKNGGLQLNGGGGEMYRDIWNTRQKTIKIEDLFKMKWDRYDYSHCTEVFDKKNFVYNFKSKVKSLLKITEETITIKELDSLLGLLREKLQCTNHANTQLFSYSLLFFMLPRLVLESNSVPYKYKKYGHFQSGLIKNLSPKIASVKSAYGYNFSKQMPYYFRLKKDIYSRLPSYMLSHFKQLSRKHDDAKRISDFINQGKRIFFDQTNGNILDKYIHFDKIYENEILSRALSVELLLRKSFINN